MLVVGKSTVPAGTAVQMEKLMRAWLRRRTIELAWNPEFLREGFAVDGHASP